MKLIFDTCKPRKDVISGDLREEMFAAHLRDVIREQADPIYRDPAIFFEHTYPTGGLKELLQEALGRLSGAKPTNSPIIRLETSFGGGKTHNLIALYHAARSGKAGSKWLKGFVDASLLPDGPIEKIAGIVGSDLDPENGLTHGDITTYTIWGEIAYQIGGAEGYKLVEKSDKNRVAPGVQVFEKLFGDAPALILLDEFSAYLRKAEAVKVEKSTLAEQSTVFLMTILSFVAKMKQVVLVLTLADSKDAFSEQTDAMQQTLKEAGSVMARQERIITPTGETEIASIVSHRLFEKIDRKAAEETAQQFLRYYEGQMARGVELPERAVRPEYRNEILSDYPFSPELITVLNRKTSTIPEFQRTRGALRLLALVVRHLWAAKPQDAWLIHTHHLDLSVDDVVNELTSRLRRPQFRQVVEADIVSPLKGSTAHATGVDEPLVQAGKAPFARRFATTVFLHSIVQGVASGVDPADALLAVLTPDDEAALVQKTVESLFNATWFLDYDGRRYRFKTEPSLNKLIADEMTIIGRSKPKEELDRRIRFVWRKGVFKPAFFPSEATEVDDDAKEPKLVVIHYEAAAVKAGESAPPELVVKIFEHAGSLEGYRTFKNNIVFLVADADQVERMIEVARRSLAIQNILDDADRMSEFNDDQKKKLKGMSEEAELQFRVSITRTYRFLYYPSADAPKKNANLAREILPAQDQGKVEHDQSEVVLRVLHGLDKVLTADDVPLSAMFLKAKAWPPAKRYTSTDDMRKEFAKRFHLKMLLDVNQLKRTIKDGCKNDAWVYQSPGEKEVYGPPSPVPTVEISPDANLYEPEEAELIGLSVKGAQPKLCFRCKNPVDQCTCGADVPQQQQKRRYETDGAAAQVFQRLRDWATDAKVTHLDRLFVKVEGRGKEAAKDARMMGLAIPQLGKGSYAVEQNMTCQFGDTETFKVSFSGTWDRYKQLKTLTDAFGQAASDVQVTTQLKAEFEGGLDLAGAQFETIRDVFCQLEFGKLHLAADAKKDEDKKK